MGKRNKPSEIRAMSEPERAWVGAMIDADGCVGLYKRANTLWQVQLVNTNVEIISALLRTVGTGSVSYRKTKKRNHHDSVCWSINAQASVEDLAWQCWPYSQKLQEVIFG